MAVVLGIKGFVVVPVVGKSVVTGRLVLHALVIKKILLTRLHFKLVSGFSVYYMVYRTVKIIWRRLLSSLNKMASCQT